MNVKYFIQMSSSLPSTLISLFSLVLAFGHTSCYEGDPKTLILFIDGFRWDYLTNLTHNTNLINFRKMYSNGSSVERIKPVFPTDCYPNIYSIFTGLLPTKHGVIFNEMYNSVNGDSFYHEDASTRQDASKWVFADTIWQQLAKKNKRSYLHHLPTCARKNSSFNANECVPYDKSQMNIQGFHESLQLSMGKLLKDDFDMAIVYHDFIDQLAHEFGPMSSEILSNYLPKMDKAIGHVLEQIDCLPDSKNLHLIFLSDHGLAQTFSDRKIHIDRFMRSEHTTRINNRGTTLSLWIIPDMYDKILSRLHTYPQRNFDIYTSKTLPLEWQLDDNFVEYFPSFYLIAHPGFVFHSEFAKLGGSESNPFAFNSTLQSRKGWHGYSPYHYEMQTPLMVYGPRAKRGLRLVGNDLYSAVNVYHLLSELMHLNPESDGVNLGRILLHQDNDIKAINYYKLIGLGFCVYLLSFIFILGCLIGNYSRKWYIFIKKLRFSRNNLPVKQKLIDGYINSAFVIADD